MVLAFQPGGPGSNTVRTLYFCHAFIISFFVTNFVRKMGARRGLAIEPLILFNVQKMDFLPNKAFPSSINDDFKRGGVTGDYSFKHGCLPI